MQNRLSRQTINHRLYHFDAAIWKSFTLVLIYVDNMISMNNDAAAIATVKRFCRIQL